MNPKENWEEHQQRRHRAFVQVHGKRRGSSEFLLFVFAVLMLVVWLSGFFTARLLG
jgi:hypothetical protein